MTAHEACEVLGIRRGASFEEIKAAYRERAKRHHPDLNGGGRDNLEHFRRVQAAYETLTRGNIELGAGTGERSDGPAGQDPLDPVRLVRAFLEENDIEILFDGSVLVVGTGVPFDPNVKTMSGSFYPPRRERS